MTAAFTLPDELVAATPPEARGLARDGVRLMTASGQGIEHRLASALPAVLRLGDLLVVNTSETIPASLAGVTAAGEPVEVHLSTVDRSGSYPVALAGTGSDWVVELRTPGGYGGRASYADRTGAVVRLTGGGTLTVTAPWSGGAASRLWTARLATPGPLGEWLRAHGEPIRYPYVAAPWPISAYRNTYADTPGSVELPSAGRALTPRTFRKLRARGVRTAGLVLHCGVSSLESGDPPYPEWYSVPRSIVEAVREARTAGRRVVAVGTTVVRALESTLTGVLEGWTDLVITPDRRLATVDGLLTGWHEPEATHQAMLRAVAGEDLVRASYSAALSAGYRWHEFGDLHLLVRPDAP